MNEQPSKEQSSQPSGLAIFFRIIGMILAAILALGSALGGVCGLLIGNDSDKGIGFLLLVFAGFCIWLIIALGSRRK
ncbi:MAG: hypothetical protein ACRCV6_08865 [Formosimonas sp.]